MRAIWKWTLQTIDEQTLRIPNGAEFLAIQVQNLRPVLWGHVEATNELENIRLITYGTGHITRLEDGDEYLGTYQLLGGQFVGHVFKAKEAE